MNLFLKTAILPLFILIFTACGTNDRQMVLIQGGTFLRNDGYKIKVSDFYLSATPVTQKHYQEITGRNPSFFKGDSLPVETVSWFEAIEFCNAKSQKEGLKPVYTINGAQVIWDKSANGYRLPTEAEFEFAARGGSRTLNYRYSGGNDLKEVGWFSENSDRKTKPVGRKKPNELGLYDMSGNVWQWCYDWFDGYSRTVLENPSGPETGGSRVGRGGSWGDLAYYSEVSFRGDDTPGNKGSDLGFRIARNAK